MSQPDGCDAVPLPQPFQGLQVSEPRVRSPIRIMAAVGYLLLSADALEGGADLARWIAVTRLT